MYERDHYFSDLSLMVMTNTSWKVISSQITVRRLKCVSLAIWNKSEVSRFTSFTDCWQYALCLRCKTRASRWLHRSLIERNLCSQVGSLTPSSFSFLFSFCVQTVFKGYSLPATASCKKHVPRTGSSSPKGAVWSSRLPSFCRRAFTTSL